MRLKLGHDGFFHHPFEYGNFCSYGIISGSAIAASSAAASSSAAAASAASVAAAGAAEVGGGIAAADAAATAAASAAAEGGAVTLADIGLYSSLGSSLIGGIGALQSGNAQSAASKYNAQIAAENSTIAQQNATWAGEAGEQQAGEASQKTRATVGAIQAAQAANNVDVNSGSAVDVRSTAAQLGELSAINIRSNAARSAYGYQTASTSQTAQSELDTYNAGQESLAGETGAATSLLGGAGNAGLNYAKYLQQSSPLSSTSLF